MFCYRRSVQNSDIYVRVDAALNDFLFVRDHVEEQIGRELTDIEARDLIEELEAREPFFVFKAIGYVTSTVLLFSKITMPIYLRKLINKISASIKARKAKKAARKAATATSSNFGR